MKLFDLPRIDDAIFNDFKACICVIGNQTCFRRSEKDAAIAGKAKTLIIDGNIYLDLKATSHKGEFVLLRAPVVGHANEIVDFGENYVSAERNEGSGELEISYERAELEAPSVDPHKVAPPRP